MRREDPRRRRRHEPWQWRSNYRRRGRRRQQHHRRDWRKLRQHRAFRVRHLLRSEHRLHQCQRRSGLRWRMSLRGGGAIATSSQTQYNAALSSIQTNDTCSCPGPGPVACVQGQCTQCSFGPSDPLGCPGNDSDGGFDTGIAVEGGEQTDSSEGDCVNVDLSTYDTSCSQDSDCTVIWAGVLCPSSFERCVLLYCRGFSAVSTSEYGRYMAAISPITSADYDASVPLGCSCPAFPHAICASGQCTSCAPLSTVGGCAERDGG
jgi:hypothetical protein